MCVFLVYLAKLKSVYDIQGEAPTDGNEPYKVTITEESANAVAKIGDLTQLWGAAPTMVRGAAKVMSENSEGAPEQKRRKRGPAKRNAEEAAQHAQQAEVLDDDPPTLETVDVSQIRRTSQGRTLIGALLMDVIEVDAKTFPETLAFDKKSAQCRIQDAGAQLLTMPQIVDGAGFAFESMRPGLL